MAGKKVLIVEKNEVVADSRADLLRDEGYDTSAGTIAEARRGAYARSGFDAVFYTLDVNPQGRDLILQLRDQQPSAKIIVYTTSFGLEYAARQIALANAEFLGMVKDEKQIAAAIESRRSGSGTGVGFAV